MIPIEMPSLTNRHGQLHYTSVVESTTASLILPMEERSESIFSDDDVSRELLQTPVAIT